MPLKALKINDNRIKTITLPDNSVITYTYHADGTRATKTTSTEYIEFHYSGSLVKEVHMNPGNHSQIYFTLHFQPTRMIYDQGSPGIKNYRIWPPLFSNMMFDDLRTKVNSIK